MTEDELAASQTTSGYARKMDESYLKRQRKLIHEQAIQSDIVVTTAQIFGAKAPTLIFEETVKAMSEGSVIVDLAIETGGNCQLSEEDKVIEKYGVRIMAPLDLATTVPHHASQLYSRNICEFIDTLLAENDEMDIENEITKSTIMCFQGAVLKGSAQTISHQEVTNGN